MLIQFHDFQQILAADMQSYRLTTPTLRTVRVPAPLIRRGPLRVRCDDEEMIPLTKVKRGFTTRELEQLAHPHLLGGKTVGEELGGQCHAGCCCMHTLQ